MAGPLEQFEIKPIVPLIIGDLDLSFTNSSLYMVIAATGAKLGKTEESAKCRNRFVAALRRSDVKIDRSCYCKLSDD